MGARHRPVDKLNFECWSLAVQKTAVPVERQGEQQLPDLGQSVREALDSAGARQSVQKLAPVLRWVAVSERVVLASVRQSEEAELELELELELESELELEQQWERVQGGPARQMG